MKGSAIVRSRGELSSVAVRLGGKGLAERQRRRGGGGGGGGWGGFNGA